MDLIGGKTDRCLDHQEWVASAPGTAAAPALAVIACAAPIPRQSALAKVAAEETKAAGSLALHAAGTAVVRLAVAAAPPSHARCGDPVLGLTSWPPAKLVE
mmetsp:Transcript_19646/g.45704  ORF Transcript_19646/g.45704 Transcript_19646/m.45704 type:complete len:101 (-) Transcript_19646:922-1224(-)